MHMMVQEFHTMVCRGGRLFCTMLTKMSIVVALWFLLGFYLFIYTPFWMRVADDQCWELGISLNSPQKSDTIPLLSLKNSGSGKYAPIRIFWVDLSVIQH